MKTFFAAAFLFLFFSCRSKTAVPDGIIPIAAMTDVMWDVLLADGLVAQRFPATNDSQKLDTSAVLYQQIVQAHGTTQEGFKKSLRFYEGRPDLLQIILDSLQKRSQVPVAAYQKDTTAAPKKDSALVPRLDSATIRKLLKRPRPGKLQPGKIPNS